MLFLYKIKKRVYRDKCLIQKLIETSVARITSALGTLVFNFVFAKFLNITDFWYFMLAYFILVGLVFLARFGMPVAIVRFAGIMFSDSKFVSTSKKEYNRSIYKA